MSEKVRSYFNVPEKYLHRSFGVRLRAEVIRDLIGYLESKLILDAGCGDGGVSLQFLSKNKITFCDLAENMLKRVEGQIESEHKHNALLVHSSIENFLSDKKYNYIFCIGVLAHVPSIQESLKNLVDHLEAEGTVVIQFSEYGHWLTKLAVSLAGYEYKVNKIYKRDLISILDQLNLRVERRVQYNFVLPGMGKLPDSFLYKIQRLTWKSSLLSWIGTEHIWTLKRK